ncbi:GNAT family N-acetyltransferase [Agromyces sp. SYSU K20354]|uniref:GNAT family N-acetyltransferase n=1 Tax=Agromyces cavernae TaxID=2898659 RepID=UPI001E5FAC9D|nr:GNAT family protein [Agromyces cavernae]MCD2440689.1 GNAT family N-acetyltransferase [Agromyces cavernae]
MHDSASAVTDAERTALAVADGPPALRFPYDAAVLVDEPLRTERLVLRPLEASDAADVFEYQRLADVIRYLPWPERDREQAYAHTAKRSAGRVLEADGDFVVLAMVRPGERSVGDEGSRGTSVGRVIGDVMVRVSNAQHAQLEVGWVVHPDFQRRGYASEAAGALVDFAFSMLNPHRVQAFLDARNEASAALCERLGMRREATLLEEEFNDGEWQDTAVYGILRREWAAARA